MAEETLKHQVDKAFKHAMLESLISERRALRMLKAEMSNAEHDPQFSGWTPEGEKKFILSYIKKLKKSLAQTLDALSGQRTKRVTDMEEEIEIVEQFAPTQLSEREVRFMVGEVIADPLRDGERNVGKLVGMVMKRYPGELDAQMVKTVVSGALEFGERLKEVKERGAT